MSGHLGHLTEEQARDVTATAAIAFGLLIALLADSIVVALSVLLIGQLWLIWHRVLLTSRVEEFAEKADQAHGAALKAARAADQALSLTNNVIDHLDGNEPLTGRHARHADKP